MDDTSIIPLVASKKYTLIGMEPGKKVLDMLKNNII